MYKDRDHGYFTIRCDGKEYKVDSFVLRLHFEVLTRACQG